MVFGARAPVFSEERVPWPTRYSWETDASIEPRRPPFPQPKQPPETWLYLTEVGRHFVRIRCRRVRRAALWLIAAWRQRLRRLSVAPGQASLPIVSRIRRWNHGRQTLYWRSWTSETLGQGSGRSVAPRPHMARVEGGTDWNAEGGPTALPVVVSYEGAKGDHRYGILVRIR